MEQQHSSSMETSDVQLISRAEIPRSVAPEDHDFDARPFLAHKILGSLMPPSGVSMTWTEAGGGGTVRLRPAPSQGLLIVLKGTARLAGPGSTSVGPGDVVTLPPNHEYGLTDAGPEGVQALHVSFGSSAHPWLGKVQSLEALLERNRAHAQRVIDGPFFGLLRTDGLHAERRRTLYLSCIRLFSDAFQTLLFTRQAMCRDGAIADAFHAHFIEELGHNRLLDVAPNERAASDSILRATSSWFCHQMLMLDNLAKLVLVNLVLETAGFHFHTFAKASLGEDVHPQYFSAHDEETEGDHQHLGVKLLEGQSPATYETLGGVLDDGWDMFDTMTRRIAHLVELETTTS